MAARIVYCYDNNKSEVGEIITAKRDSFGMLTGHSFIVLCLGQLGNVLRGVAERDPQFSARQYDRIEKSLIP